MTRVQCAATATAAVGCAYAASARNEDVHFVFVSLAADEAAAPLRTLCAARRSQWPVFVSVGADDLPVDAALPSPPPDQLLAALISHCFPT